MQMDGIRGFVGAVDHHMSRLSAEAATGIGRTTIGDLTAAWAELVKKMALGPEPELRECPVCHESGMRAATLNGYCWTALVPLAPAASALAAPAPVYPVSTRRAGGVADERRGSARWRG
jgi:hypothetical protein